jgi:hypothetical protein
MTGPRAPRAWPLLESAGFVHRDGARRCRSSDAQSARRDPRTQIDVHWQT